MLSLWRARPAQTLIEPHTVAILHAQLGERHVPRIAWPVGSAAPHEESDWKAGAEAGMRTQRLGGPVQVGVARQSHTASASIMAGGQGMAHADREHLTRCSTVIGGGHVGSG